MCTPWTLWTHILYLFCSLLKDVFTGLGLFNVCTQKNGGSKVENQWNAYGNNEKSKGLFYKSAFHFIYLKKSIYFIVKSFILSR